MPQHSDFASWPSPDQAQSLPLPEKHDLARRCIALALRQAQAAGRPASIGWTGGKDSTTLLWLTMETCRREALPLPGCCHIDDGDVFPEIESFVAETTARWNLAVTRLRNEALLAGSPAVGDVLALADVGEENAAELRRLGHESPYWQFEPESFLGSHLTKTLPLRAFLERERVHTLFVGLRRDEQPARQDEAWSHPRADPDHLRVHPLLHYRERDIWETIHGEGLPFCELYRLGYRSLGARSTTLPVAAVPAWEQDLERTSERQGRGQDKEAVMEQLRALGYM